MKLLPTVVLVLLACPAFAQPTEDFLDGLRGAWVGEGEVMGMRSTLEMSWQPVLQGAFYQLLFHNRMERPSGESWLFEGMAYYRRIGNDVYEGTWFDSGAEHHPIRAVVEGDSLVADWGTADTKQGRTVYRLTDSSRMEITDLIRREDGSWSVFGRTSLVRADLLPGTDR